MYFAVTLCPYASEEQGKPTLLWVHVAIQGCGRSNERPYKIYKNPHVLAVGAAHGELGMCHLLVVNKVLYQRLLLHGSSSSSESSKRLLPFAKRMVPSLPL